MDRRQGRILRIYSSFTVGIGGLLLSVPLALILGSLFLTPSEHGHAFFSPQEATLFLFSILLGMFIAIIVGVKYYRFRGKAK